MNFQIVESGRSVTDGAPDTAYLLTDNWDDWFKFSTLYFLVYYDANGSRHDLGGVKIGQFGMASEQRRPGLPEEFDQLDERFFSLGQDADYYERAHALGPAITQALLDALNDIVIDDVLYRRARAEPVLGVSLMRDVNERTLVGQFRRIVAGGTRLTSYGFSYRGPRQLDSAFKPVELSFAVDPFSKPPSNIQVIIGRNGVGKSFLLNAMSRALVDPDDSTAKNGKFIDHHSPFEEEFESPFANVVSVTFSAFDEFPLLGNTKNALKGPLYTSVGLRKRRRSDEEDGTRSWDTVTQDTNALASEFITSARLCALGERRERWLQVLGALETDPMFAEAAVGDLLNSDRKKFGQRAGHLFRQLSSGHKIVLLTATKLVEKVDERTLVLVDEPEAHLHPPLLAAFVRALSDLLTNRNGVAIVATHSPVVLQEVPSTCVWKIRRYGGAAIAERLRIETFAEHVGHLTHEVFGLEVTRSGFHKMITEAVEDEDDFHSVSEKFDSQVGSEGRALISMLLAQRKGVHAAGNN